MKNYKSEPQDIKVYYKSESYSRLERSFIASRKIEFTDLSLILSLLGHQKGQCVKLEENDGGKEHTFSRTTYNRNTIEFDSFYGLLTILGNLDMKYDEVINKMAFLKTSTTGKKFSGLTNVKYYFGYLLGGIEYFHDIAFQYSFDDLSEIYDSIMEFIEIDASELIEFSQKIKKEEDL